MSDSSQSPSQRMKFFYGLLLFVIPTLLLLFIFKGGISGLKSKKNQQIVTRKFRLDPQVLRKSIEIKAVDPKKPTSEKNETTRQNLLVPVRSQDVQKIIEEYGIKFASGTSLAYNEFSQELVVTQTEEVLEQIDQLIGTHNHFPPHAILELRLVSMSLNSIENILKQEHSARRGMAIQKNDLFEKIQQLVNKKEATILDVLQSRTLSGETAQQKKSKEYSYIENYTISNGIPQAVKATRELGLIMECKPTISESRIVNMTIFYENVTLNPRIHTTDIQFPGVNGVFKIESPEFIKNSVNQSYILAHGTTIILGIFDRIAEHYDPHQKIVVLMTARVLNEPTQ